MLDKKGMARWIAFTGLILLTLFAVYTRQKRVAREKNFVGECLRIKSQYQKIFLHVQLVTSKDDLHLTENKSSPVSAVVNSNVLLPIPITGEMAKSNSDHICILQNTKSNEYLSFQIFPNDVNNSAFQDVNISGKGLGVLSELYQQGLAMKLTDLNCNYTDYEMQVIRAAQAGLVTKLVPEDENVKILLNASAKEDSLMLGNRRDTNTNQTLFTLEWKFPLAPEKKWMADYRFSTTSQASRDQMISWILNKSKCEKCQVSEFSTCVEKVLEKK